jgi:FKBP12-rapamycin complex-associated protein
MGILGALDPYKYQQVEERSPERQLRLESTQLTDISLMMTGLTPSSKEYFPTVVINALLQILKDQSLAQHHPLVVEAIMQIFRTLQLECIPFLDKVVPAFIAVIKTGRGLESYFSQLSILVTIVKQHIRNFLPDIVTVLRDQWTQSVPLQANILLLIEAISRSLEGEFKIYLASILPLMLGVFDKDNSPGRLPSGRVLHAFLVFGPSAEEYMHLIIPVIVSVFEKPQQPGPLRVAAIQTIGKISRQVNLNDFASKIIHPLARVLATTDTSGAPLRVAALETLCALISQLGKDYLHFANTINKVLALTNQPHPQYDLLLNKLQKGEVLPQDLTADERHVESAASEVQNKKLDMNPVHLKAAWDSSGKTTKEDWQEWMRRFSVTVLAESPNQALRACTSLASIYPPLARELFNSAFVSCWGDLFEPYQVLLTLDFSYFLLIKYRTILLCISKLPSNLLTSLQIFLEFYSTLQSLWSMMTRHFPLIFVTSVAKLEGATHGQKHSIIRSWNFFKTKTAWQLRH